MQRTLRPESGAQEPLFQCLPPVQPGSHLWGTWKNQRGLKRPGGRRVSARGGRQRLLATQVPQYPRMGPCRGGTDRRGPQAQYRGPPVGGGSRRSGDASQHADQFRGKPPPDGPGRGGPGDPGGGLERSPKARRPLRAMAVQDPASDRVRGCLWSAGTDQRAFVTSTGHYAWPRRAMPASIASGHCL